MKNILVFIGNLSAFIFSSSAIAHEGSKHSHGIGEYISIVVLSLVAGFLILMIIKSFNNQAENTILKGE